MSSTHLLILIQKAQSPEKDLVFVKVVSLVQPLSQGVRQQIFPLHFAVEWAQYKSTAIIREHSPNSKSCLQGASNQCFWAVASF